MRYQTIFRMFRRFVLSILLLAAAAPSFACTTAIISAKASATGHPLMWKQRDTSAGYNYMDWFPATDSTYSFTGVVNTKDEARESVWCGSNEVGLSIMNSVAYGLSPIITDDRPYEGMVMKKALETCRTVDEFETLLKNLPQPNGLETNFGVIDAEGGAAYFETHDLGYTRFNVDDAPEGYLIRSNWSFTGREGKGKGYDRYDVAAAKMAAHTGGFTPEWILDELGRDPLIARKTTVSSVVFEGVISGERADATVMWSIVGYTPFCYAIPVWVAARNRIPGPLRHSAIQGSRQNELAKAALEKYGDIEPDVPLSAGQSLLLDKVRVEESIAIGPARLIDERMRRKGADMLAISAINELIEKRFDEFVEKYYPQH